MRSRCHQGAKQFHIFSDLSNPREKQRSHRRVEFIALPLAKEFTLIAAGFVPDGADVGSFGVEAPRNRTPTKPPRPGQRRSEQFS